MISYANRNKILGMIFVTTLFITFGFFGYLRWGEDVAGSLTLNLPQHEMYFSKFTHQLIASINRNSCRLAQIVKITVSLGMWLTFPLQFFVPIQIIWPHIQQKFGPFKNPVKYELMFRTIMVLLTCKS